MKSAEFEALVEQHYPRIRRAATLLAGDRWDADDLAQETFLQALRSWSRFQRRSRVDTWLYAILLNLHRRRLRSQARSWRRLLEWFRRTPAANDRPEPPPSFPVERQEELNNIWGVVATLPVAQQHALVLKYSEGLSYEQIAAAQQCPVGTVKSRLHHGLAALKDKLAPKSETSKQHVPFLADTDHDSIRTKIRS